MANIKINDLSPAASAAGTQQLETDTGGSVASKVTVAQVATFVGETETYSALTTVSKEIVGAINELESSIPNAVKNSSNPGSPDFFAGMQITGDGQTAFTLSAPPVGIKLYLNGVLQPEGLAYTVSGTSLTWLDLNGLTLVAPPAPNDSDELITVFNDISGASPPKIIFLSAADYNSNNGDYRVRPIGGTSAQNFTFYLPNDLSSIVAFKAIGIPSAGAAGTLRDIDLSSEYGMIGEVSNFHSETDTSTTYDLTGTSGKLTEVVDLTIVLSAVAGGDYMGINIDHNSIGGSIDYIGFKLIYNI